MSSIEIGVPLTGGEKKYPEKELRERIELIGSIYTSLAKRHTETDSTTTKPVTVFKNKHVLYTENFMAAEGPSVTLDFLSPFISETMTYVLTESSDIFKVGSMKLHNQQITYATTPDNTCEKPLEVPTEELRHLATLIKGESGSRSEIGNLTRLPRPKASTLRQAYPTLVDDEGAASVNVFPEFIPGLRRVHTRPGKQFSLVDKDYFRSKNPRFKRLSSDGTRPVEWEPTGADQPQESTFLKRRAALRKAYEYFKIHNDELIQQISDLDLVCSILGVRNLSGIPDALTPDKRRELMIIDANRLIATTFGGKAQDVYKGYIKPAIKFISSAMRTGIREFRSQDTGMRGEVSGAGDVITLLDLMFNNDSEQVRAEAKKVLLVMKNVAEMDKRYRELGKRINDDGDEDDDKDQDQKTVKKRQARNKSETATTGDLFLRLLTEKVWSPEMGPENERVFLLGKFSLDKYRCIGVEEIAENQREEIKKRIKNHKHRIQKTGYYLRSEPISRRYFEYDGELIPVGFDDRPEKDFYSGVEKTFRKGVMNPERSVPDTKGWIFIVRNRHDAIALKRKIELAAKSLGSLILTEDTEDTSEGQAYSARNPGSSSELHMIKYIALYHNDRWEIEIFTEEDYLNSKFQDEVAHEGYQLARLRDSGLSEAIHPTKYYGEKASNERINVALAHQREHKRGFDQDDVI